MPIRTTPGTDVQYYLIAFDEDGNERGESDGTLLSDTVRQRVADAANGITDVFFTSHGWKGDIPAAIEQYDAWIGAMAKAQPDRLAAREGQPGFTPIIVGLHWPSLPWGDEDIPSGDGSAGGAVLSAGDEVSAPIEAQVDAYAKRIADTPAARAAIRTILEAARRDPDSMTLSPAVRAAYDALFAESGLAAGDASGRPGADQDGFDAGAIIDQAKAGAGEGGQTGTPGLLGFGDDMRNLALMPLRQMSFWKMKDRARAFGEAGGHALLSTLQRTAPNARFHLMGHSFGCIVVSATVAGAPKSLPLPRPVDSLFLVQGALSLWAYAADIPYAPGTAGYFHRIMKDKLVRGPIVTTRSTRDTAVGKLYPLGAKLKKQLVLADPKYPQYGGIGSFGIQGVGAGEDMRMQSATYTYSFSGGRVYNLEASGIIKNGGGPGGAHSDIAHPEVAHAFWAAVLAGLPSPGSPPTGGAQPATRSAAPSATRSAAPQPPPPPPPDFETSGFTRGGDTRGKPGLLGAEPPSAPVGSAPGPATRSLQPAAMPERSASKPELEEASPPSAPVASATRPPSMSVRSAAEPEWLEASNPTSAAAPESAAPESASLESPARESAAPESSAPSAPSAPAAPTTPTDQRWINAELEDHKPDEPLAAGKSYTLAFDVDVVQRETAVSTAALSDANLFSEETDEVELTVQLDSDDFDISERTRPLRLPRVGRSRGKARFDISPKHDGPSTVKATIHKDGNFIQQMELTFDVGATGPTTVQVTSMGRPPSAASMVQPRDVGLSISPAAGGGYDCVVWGSVSSRARLTIQQAHLASAIEAARQEIMKVVMHQDAAGEYVFQTGIDIPEVDSQAALRTMARAGALLFQKIFFGPAAGADSKAVGEFLVKMASDKTTRLKLQIVAESTPVPWGLLYVGDASAAATLNWENFIGMRHVIEQIPLQTTLSVSDSAIPSDKPELTVSLNTNDGIDAQMGADFVARQQVFWKDAVTSRKRVRVTSRTTSAEVIKALADGNTDDQIIYFYCHAEAAGLADAGGPDTSCLVLTDARITLGDLSLDAPTSTQLKGNPLVFINACESAELSPAFYDGFVPYFMAKGARGVVGTECKTPALFAVEWARRFFDLFLDGGSLGETFLDLRREFLEQHRNPLGLMYAVHCDGDTQVQPSLVTAS